MSSDKKWKDALLSSGLPLEATVAGQLENQGCHVFGEYEFPVFTLEGQQILRSVDLHAYWDTPAADLNLAVECKYRRDEIRWFFLPPSLRELRASDWITNCLVSPFVPPWYCSTVITPPVVKFGHHPTKEGFDLPVVSKGVEIIPGKPGTGKDESANESAIRNALTQVRYGAASMMFGFPPLAEQDFDTYLSRNFRFILPIVVTTAELLLLKQKAGVPEIRSAEVPEDVAEPVDAVIQEISRLDQLLSRHSKILLADNYESLSRSPETASAAESGKQRMFGPVPSNRSTFADLQTMCGPSRVIVVRLDHMGHLLGTLRQLLTDEGLLQRYDWLERTSPDGIIYDVARHRAGRADGGNASG